MVVWYLFCCNCHYFSWEPVNILAKLYGHSKLHSSYQGFLRISSFIVLQEFWSHWSTSSPVRTSKATSWTAWGIIILALLMLLILISEGGSAGSKICVIRSRWCMQLLYCTIVFLCNKTISPISLLQFNLLQFWSHIGNSHAIFKNNSFSAINCYLAKSWSTCVHSMLEWWGDLISIFFYGLHLFLGTTNMIVVGSLGKKP